MVVNGAGAAAIACCQLYAKLGVKKENIVMLDRKGIIQKCRKELDIIKSEFATERSITSLEEALVGADVFIGLSSADTVTPAMLLSMADNPIVFALSNPNPEIAYELAIATRQDIIMATGRSDYPNQVNNVLCFPYIFRGALDVLASEINEEMKIAAVNAIASLAKKEITEDIKLAYGISDLEFGKKYILPKPTDKRLKSFVSSAVAEAAIKSGVARRKIEDLTMYKRKLEEILSEEVAV
jgi:malate dehydrogenase (oxaloacetate-decarboxylating)(NADP+)